MKNYYLKLELLSDSVPGAGEGIGGIIDIDICYDKFGFPYIPSKRIKGILRESGRDLEDMGIIKNGNIERIFGKRGNDKEGDFKISNGYLENYEILEKLGEYINNNDKLKSMFSPQRILEYYTYLRYQTSIDEEEGVAKKRSLRGERVLKKGLKFYFLMEFPEKYEKDIEKICKITRNFGINRSRGMGEIKLTLETLTPKNEESLTIEPFEYSKNTYAIKYKLKLLEPILISQKVERGTKTDTYIPGTFLLGVFANKYINKINSNNVHEDSKFRELFLESKVRFLPAYPEVNERETRPIPASLRKIKDKEEYLDLAYNEDRDKAIEKKLQLKRINGYIGLRGGKRFFIFNPEISIEYHHQRPSDRRKGHALKEGEGEFYQFETLNNDQNFSGLILSEDKDLLKLLQELIPNNTEIKIGKSRTAQYGRVKITYEKDEEENLENYMWKPEESIGCYLESPMILRNNNGYYEPDPNIFLEEIKKLVKTDKIEIQQSFIKCIKLGGYMNVWRLPKIQINGLDMGTTLILKNNSKKDIPFNLLIDKNFGERIGEGFGKVKFYPLDEKRYENLYLEKDENFINIGSEISNIKDLIEYIFDKIMKIEIKKEVIDKDIKITLSNSFLGRLESMLYDSDSFESFEEKINSLRKPAKKNLEKLIEKKIRDNKISIIFISKELKILKGNFEDLLLSKDIYKNEVFKKLREKANIKEKWWDNKKLFEYYSLYLSLILRKLRWENRQK